MKLATFNARAETVGTKPMFRDAFQEQAFADPRERLLGVARRARRQAAVLFHAPRRSTDYVRGLMVELERQRDRRISVIVHDGDHGAE
jgi:hypothetical protein